MNYMTKEDRERVENRLATLEKKRKELSDRIGRARELGDLKENAEYHTAKDDQGFNEQKIRDLKQKLLSVVIVDDQDIPEGMVFIGATVKLRDTDSGGEELYRLVGEVTDDDSDYLEVTPNSPLGLSLMKARVGEVVTVDLPRGKRTFEIVEIG